MKKAIILNGLSGNLKTTITNKLKELHPEIKVIGSPHRFVESTASKFFSKNYALKTELIILFKLHQLEMLKPITDGIYVFDKTLIESIMFNRLITSDRLMYNVNKDYVLTDENIKALILEEIEYFSTNFDKVARISLETYDELFIESMLSNEDDLRSETFWDAPHYLECQSYYTTFLKENVKIDYSYKINNLEETLSELSNISHSLINLVL